MEKPEEQLSVFVSELNGQIQDLQRSVASVIAEQLAELTQEIESEVAIQAEAAKEVAEFVDGVVLDV
jgi:hypothetical protein